MPEPEPVLKPMERKALLRSLEVHFRNRTDPVEGMVILRLLSDHKRLLRVAHAAAVYVKEPGTSARVDLARALWEAGLGPHPTQGGMVWDKEAPRG
jgi:hypothetical protein